MHRPINSRFVFKTDESKHLLRVIGHNYNNRDDNQCDQCFFHDHDAYEGHCDDEWIEEQTGQCEDPGIYFKLIKSKSLI